MSQKKFLTKSKFIKAYDCPTKLYYDSNKEKYTNYDLEDDYMEGLAKGGFQVATLARAYYPDNITVSEKDHKSAVDKTDFLLRRDKVVISEAAFLFDNCFVRVDLLIKDGNDIKLIEIKSKLYKPKNSKGDDEDPFRLKNGGIKSEWRKHIADISFQQYVLSHSYPDYNIECKFMLPDKEKTASVDGLNQKFLIKKTGKGSHTIKTRNTRNLGDKILTMVNVDDLVDMFQSESFSVSDKNYNFSEYIHFLCDNIKHETIIYDKLSKSCKKCEFRNNGNFEDDGLKDGFKQCWKHLGGLKDEDFDKPSVLEIWDNKRLSKHISENKLLQEHLSNKDLIVKTSKQKQKDYTLSRVDRQILQLEKNRHNDKELYCEHEGLREEMEKWKFPLHFIDFETTIVAVPFHKGMRPFEDIVFQFSHHIIHKNKKVEHAGQWINTQKGHFPNFDFIRELKNQLENDNGSIFKFGAHENTMLNTIYTQLEKSNESDKLSLMDWVKTITNSTHSRKEFWQGERSMIDMCDLVKKYYYDPHTNGSNSIKDVLPAVINSSEYLLNKYRKKIYGKGKKINSLNFDEMAWVTRDRKTGECINPYKKLPKVFDGYSEEEQNKLFSDATDLSDGGAAMTAYVMMQFSDISTKEKKDLVNALLKYCELDTLAMVMIWEHWDNIINI